MSKLGLFTDSNAGCGVIFLTPNCIGSRYTMGGSRIGQTLTNEDLFLFAQCRGKELVVRSVETKEENLLFPFERALPTAFSKQKKSLFAKVLLKEADKFFLIWQTSFFYILFFFALAYRSSKN